MRKSLKIGIVTPILAVLAVVGGTQVAQAVDDPLAPDVSTADSAFYTTAQIDEVWGAITSNYPEALPAGVTFPKDAPSFFHPTGEISAPIFEVGLPELIAARYWRCAWIDSSLDSASSGRVMAEAKAETAIEDYAALPAVEDLVDVPSYEADMAEYAESVDADPLVAEFDAECAIYTEAGNVR